MAKPYCLRWLAHWMRRADSRAACTAGKSSATKTPMMAITTSSSTSVNAGRATKREARDIRNPFGDGDNRNHARCFFSVGEILTRRVLGVKRQLDGWWVRVVVSGF